MVVIILAAALGAIFSIVVVLLFRRINEVARHTAEVDETVRQLTETDVELYRELLRLQRSLNGGPTAGRETRKAAVGGGDPSAPPSNRPPQEPARRKRHLALYILSAAILALTALMREALRAYRGRIAGALVGATTTVSAVTVLTLTPWHTGVDRPPSSAPTAAPKVHASQHVSRLGRASSGSSAGLPSATAAGASPAADGPSPPPVGGGPSMLVPVADTSSPASVRNIPAPGITPAETPETTQVPTAGTSPAPSAPSAPSSAPAGTGVCATVSAGPVGGVDVCLPLSGGG